jgi:hypothetical protein
MAEEEEQVAADMQEDEAYLEYDEGGLEAEGGAEEGGEPMDVSFLFVCARAVKHARHLGAAAGALWCACLNWAAMMLLDRARHAAKAAGGREREQQTSHL